MVEMRKMDQKNTLKTIKKRYLSGYGIDCFAMIRISAYMFRFLSSAVIAPYKPFSSADG